MNQSNVLLVSKNGAIRHCQSRRIVRSGLLGLLAPVTASTARAETSDEWVKLGERIHGGFGSYIALGIRVHLHAVEQLHTKLRELQMGLCNKEVMTGSNSAAPTGWR